MQIEEKQNESLGVRAYDNQMKKSKSLHPAIPQPPFSLLICSPKGGGKTTLLLNLLYKRHKKKNAFYRHYFDSIYVFSPTFKLDKKLNKIGMLLYQCRQRESLSIAHYSFHGYVNLLLYQHNDKFTQKEITELYGLSLMLEHAFDWICEEWQS